MNPTTLKLLTESAIKEAAEYLMTLNNETSTLEVKNHLRSKGFSASQSEVSQGMNDIWTANKNTWAFKQLGAYKLYYLTSDTNKSIHAYLEKGDDFWAIAAKDKSFTIEVGKVGETGVFEEKNYDTNRKMAFVAESLLEVQEQKGFVEAKDSRLPLKVRQQFAPYFHQKMTGCKMGFFEAEKLVKQKATFEVGGQQIEGYLLLTKSAGYSFNWSLPKDLEVVKQVLKAKKWDALQLGFEEAKLLGEKVKDAKVFDSEGTELKDGTYKILAKQTAMETQAILVDNQHLYQIECFFEGGERAVLSKFQMDLEGEMLPLVNRFL
ncbi:MAG: hypothetical protein R3E32_12175 [Chitinophagales bacterium]